MEALSVWTVSLKVCVGGLGEGGLGPLLDGLLVGLLGPALLLLLPGSVMTGSNGHFPSNKSSFLLHAGMCFLLLYSFYCKVVLLLHLWIDCVFFTG